MSVTTCVLTGLGINADLELAEAFKRAGSEVARVHVNDLVAAPSILASFDILAFPGGFSFGDHLGSGKVLAGLVAGKMRNELSAFIGDGKLVIGICNGFQTLVKMGLLPNIDGAMGRAASLVHNESGRFIDDWVRVAPEAASPCVWTRGLGPMDMPIRHGEGRFVWRDADVAAEAQRLGLVALRYEGRNPNGSQGAIAGITDPSGRALGIMPHPEAFLGLENHPGRRRIAPSVETGLALFRKGVETVERGL
jgi:phosphoribosylformylglycinamidine synthase